MEKAIVNATSTIKDGLRLKSKKNKTKEAEMREGRRKKLAIVCRKSNDEEQGKEEKEEYYRREAHGNERQEYCKTETGERKAIRLQCLLMGTKFLIPVRPCIHGWRF